MALNPQVSTAGRNAMLNALLALVNVGGVGSVKIYDGAQPANTDTAVSTQQMLVSCALSATAFGQAANGSAAANAITPGNPAIAGTAAWFRIFSGAGTPIFDGTVGTAGCDLTIGSTTITLNVPVSPSALTVNHP